MTRRIARPAMTRRIAAVVATVALAIAAVRPPPALAAPPGAPDAGRVLRDANRALVAGLYPAAERLARALDPSTLPDADRAEVHRILGLSAYFLGRLDDAERELLVYLKLDLDARLDPAITPPEAITFFEEVRARHAADLRALRPRPGPPGSMLLAFLPPIAQFQNRQPLKGWIALGLETSLLAANISSYAILRQWCNENDRTCEGHEASARRMRTLNRVTGYGFLAVYAIGVVDGIIGLRRLRAREAELQVVPVPGGAAVVGRF
jgi:hypothetical protein